MSKRDDGGRAFPTTTQDPDDQGMTLRDYFAGQAMPAMAPSLSIEEIAQKSYEIADAMLRERGK